MAGSGQIYCSDLAMALVAVAGLVLVGGECTAIKLDQKAEDGGAGTASSISGTSVPYAGGGGGGAGEQAASGLLVVLVAAVEQWDKFRFATGTAGTVNTGGGGGGGGYVTATGGVGGAGGSGIVILKYVVTPVTTVDVVQTFEATSSWTCPTGVTEVEYLVVAGGGGAGGTHGGGGGAGGFRTATGFQFPLGQLIQLL
jgi:hypothetical protein